MLEYSLYSELGCCSVVDLFSVCDELVNSLSNFGLIGPEQVDFALDSELVACSNARLSVLAFTDKEGELGVSSFHCLVVGADVGSTK